MALPAKLMSLADLSPAQIQEVIAVARRLKSSCRRVLPPTGYILRDAAWREAESNPTRLSAPPQSLRNMSIALLFSKRSTRTRVSAETAAKLLGGQAIFLGREDIQLGVNESARDTAKVLSGMCQGIFARVGEHSEIEELAKYATVPVINALSSLWHPTQVLADLQTLYEENTLQEESTPAPNPHTVPYSSSSPSPDSTSTPEESAPNTSSSEQQQDLSNSGKEQPSKAAAAQHRITQRRRQLRPLTIAYVGDSANVLHDMLVTYPRLGHKLQIASPPDPRYRAPSAVWDKVVELGCDKDIEWTADPRDAVKGADVIITDTWVSMGQEAEYEQRVKDFQGYQVTEELCKSAKENWKFLHCLPRKSHEVNDEVFYGPRSLVFREADNRKWTIMALFHLLFGGGSYSALPHGRPRPSYQPNLTLNLQSRIDEETQTKLNITPHEASNFNKVFNKIFNASKIALQDSPNTQKKNVRSQGNKRKGGNTGNGTRTPPEVIEAVEKEVEAATQLKENLGKNTPSSSNGGKDKKNSD